MSFALFSRFTRHLIGKARHVTAVDFMEKFVEKNKKDNSHLGNAEFIQADVTKLDFPKHRYIFSPIITATVRAEILGQPIF